NCTDANRDLVKDAGFRCCCSCFGGVNGRSQDPFDLARVPTSTWYTTPDQFGFEVAFGRSVTRYDAPLPAHPPPAAPVLPPLNRIAQPPRPPWWARRPSGPN